MKEMVMSIRKNASTFTLVCTLLIGCFLSYPALSRAVPLSPPAHITGAAAADVQANASNPGNAITAIYVPTSGASANGVVLATWLDTNDYPTYSAWNGSNWSAASAITTSAAISGLSITTTYNPSTETVLATWIDNSTHFPFYSVWSDSSWSTAAQIPGSRTAKIFSPINAIYDAAHQTVVVAWIDNSSSHPYYSIWSGGTTWAPDPPTAITTTYTAGSSITLTYDAANGTVLVTWLQSGLIPWIYSVWDGTMWGGAAEISAGAASTPPATTYNPADGTIFATWINATTRSPYFSYWNGTTWSTAAIIPGAQSLTTNDPINGLITTINVYNATNWTILTMWLDFYITATFPSLNSFYPTYSVWNGSNWSSNPELITGAATATNLSKNFNITAAYNTAKGTVLTSWIDDGSKRPTYSIWDGTNWSLAPLPVAGAAYPSIPVTTVYNAANGTTLILWISAGSRIPSYSVYTPR